jgi:3-dehydroquinate synthase II
MPAQLWVQPTGNADEVAGGALEAGADRIVATPEQRDAVDSVGRVPLAERNGDTIELGDGQARVLTIEDPEDQDQARKLLGEVDQLVLDAADWSIIPLENLIAWREETDAELFARVTTPEEAEIALTTMETGADGLLFATDDPVQVHEVAETLDRGSGSIDLTVAEVHNIEPAGMGDRVCVDTTSLLAPDEGLLVGSRSAFLALVASEATEAGYVSSRPFRVNAGAVHGYALAPDDETRYLSEVRAGVRLLAIDREGNTRTVAAGRAKIERRPLLLVELATEDDEGTLVLQNAETIRLVTPEGPRSVADLEEGDEVLVHEAHAGGRHFGQAIEETVREV